MALKDTMKWMFKRGPFKAPDPTAVAVKVDASNTAFNDFMSSTSKSAREAAQKAATEATKVVTDDIAKLKGLHSTAIAEGEEAVARGHKTKISELVDIHAAAHAETARNIKKDGNKLVSQLKAAAKDAKKIGNTVGAAELETRAGTIAREVAEHARHFKAQSTAIARAGEKGLLGKAGGAAKWIFKGGPFTATYGKIGEFASKAPGGKKGALLIGAGVIAAITAIAGFASGAKTRSDERAQESEAMGLQASIAENRDLQERLAFAKSARVETSIAAGEANPAAEKGDPRYWSKRERPPVVPGQRAT